MNTFFRSFKSAIIHVVEVIGLYGLTTSNVFTFLVEIQLGVEDSYKFPTQLVRVGENMPFNR
jgi:hypothetical protein